MSDQAPATLPPESSFQVTHIRRPASDQGGQHTTTSDLLTSAQAIAFIADSAKAAADEGLSEEPGEAVGTSDSTSSSAADVPVSTPAESGSPDAAELGDS